MLGLQQSSIVLLPEIELNPAGHVTQLVAFDVGEYVPTSQFVQAAEPLVFLNFPVTHAVHVPPEGPVNPTLHGQLVDTVQPLHEAPEFAGHATHVPPSGP